jgi:hypothetical protein
MKAVINLITTIGLYIRNLLTLTRLEISDIKVSREIIVGKTRTRIQWHIKGCHRIFVDGYLELPGIIRGVAITEHNLPKVHTIRFFGYYGVWEYQVEVPATDIHFFRQFNSRIDRQEVSALQEIRPVVFNAQPEIPGFQTRISILPIAFDLETHSLNPERNQSSNKM